jgi:hypothetical protein
MSTVRAAFLLFLMQTWSLSAFAQDQSVLATARHLGEEGLSAYDAGRYDEAAEKLTNAYRAVKVPTFARNAARALAKQGKLLAASELYLEATRLSPNKLWRGDLQQQAQKESAEERAALLPRLSHLKLVLEGPSAEETQVSIDGAEVPESLLSMEQLTDPGLRHVVAKRGNKTVEQNVQLQEGQHRELVLRFGSAPKARLTSTSSAPLDRPSKSADTAPATSKKGGTQRTLGWIGIGLGSAGLATGATAGILALSKRSSLHKDGCNGEVCPDPRFQSRVDSYNAMLTVSTLGLIVGGVVAATGVTLLLTSPKRESKPSVSMHIGPGSVMLAGGF